MDYENRIDVNFEDENERKEEARKASERRPVVLQGVDGHAVDVGADGSVLAPQQTEVRPVDEEPEPLESPDFDWLTEVAIPLSIFGLLGCLLFYLIDLRQSHGGQFSGGLRWVCFFFLAAAIGIARIRTKYGNRLVAAPYMLALAVTMTLAVLRFTTVEGGLTEALNASGQFLNILFNLCFVALIWWLADKVTRETTLEENVAYSLNQGLLSDRNDQPETAGAAAKPRHPGRIVFWVSVGAVLAFGLGTRSMGDESRYATHAFWTMGGYVFSALLVLAMTNLSAIRMDVRRRGVRMNWTLVPTWIITSLLLVLGIVLLSAALPRPRLDTGREFTLGERPAWVRVPEEGIRGWTPGSGFSQPPSGATAPAHDPETNGDGAPTSGGEENSQGASSQQQEDAQGDQGQNGTQGGANSTSAGAASSGGGQSAGQGESGQGGEGGEGSQGDAQSESRGENRRFSWWLLLLLLLLLALLIYLAIRYRRQIAAALRAFGAQIHSMWMAFLAFLERLRERLGLGRRVRAGEFADLPEDPFADIWEKRELGANMTPAQIVRHVYRAFLAFCSLRGHARPSHQTEFEFLRTVPPRIGLEEKDQRAITSMYVFATYSPNEVGVSYVERARDVWSRLRPAIDRTLEAQAAAKQSKQPCSA